MDKINAKQVIAVTYASPRVGNKEFRHNYDTLERAGKLRHVRVSNEGDIVAVAPSMGYWQTGLNLHVKPDGRMETKYQNEKSFWSQMNFGAVEKHGLGSYHERMSLDENKEILDMSVDDLYKNFTDFGS